MWKKETRIIAKMKQTLCAVGKRAASTLTKEAGDISSVFPSLSGKKPDPLPPRFGQLKKELIRGNEDAVRVSWQRLVESLQAEVHKIKSAGSNVCWQLFPVLTNF